MDIFGGIITSIARVVMLGWPFDSILLLTIIAGVWLVALGTIQILRAFQIRGDNRRAPQLPRYAGRRHAVMKPTRRLTAHPSGTLDSRIRKTAGALGGPALGVLAIGAIVVCALAALVGCVLDSVREGDGIAAVDRPTVAWLAEHRHPVLTTVMRVVSVVGSPVSAWAVAIIVCAFVAWRIHHWLPVVVAGLGMAGFSLTVTVVKLVVHRQRRELPYSVIAAHGCSFPSGHAMGVTTSALISAWAMHHWIIRSAGARIALWTAAIAIIAGVGFSRVYLGVHYPSDVITGWALGVIWVGVLIAFVAFLEQRSAAADSTVRAGQPAASSHHDSSSLGNNSSATSN